MVRKYAIEAWIVGVLGAGVIGCGGGSTPAAAPTTPAATADSATPAVEATAAAPAAPVLAPVEQRLPGEWKGKMIVDEEGIKTLPAEAKVEDLRSHTLVMAFSADGRIRFNGEIQGQAYQTEGQWQLVKEEGNHVTIKSTEDGKEKDSVLMFESNDVFYIPVKTEVAVLGAMKFERMR